MNKEREGEELLAGLPEPLAESFRRIREQMLAERKAAASEETPGERVAPPATAKVRPLVKPAPPTARMPEAPKPDPTHTRYDHSLAEFPAFRFGTRRRKAVRDLIRFSDTITGPDGAPLERGWTVYPSIEGYGGATTQSLLFELHQVWKEQAFAGRRISFGTLRSLFERIYPGENPNDLRYAQIRRDLDILCGYKFDCENAFWDPRSRSYGTMRRWSIFTGWFEATRSKAGQAQIEIPMGFIEVSDTFAAIAKQRGFFVTGFESPFFHQLSPHEQRLALYLSKMFVSQKVHRRAEEELYAALPIEGGELWKKRQTLRATAAGLIEKGYPNLERFEVERSTASGRWLGTFYRKRKVAQDRPLGPYKLEDLEPRVRLLIEDILELTHDPGSTRFYVGAVEALGEEAVRAALSELRGEVLQSPARIKNRGAWLTTKLIETGKERGIRFTRHAPRPAATGEK